MLNFFRLAIACALAMLGSRAVNGSTSLSVDHLYRPDTMPIVYTGIIEMPPSDRTVKRALKFITRINFIKTGVHPSGVVKYRATVVLHLKDDASPEYPSLTFNDINVRPGQRQVILSSNKTSAADNPKLPTIVLNFDGSLSSATGTIVNLSHESGTLSLKNGWDYDPQGVEDAYGGVYEGGCYAFRGHNDHVIKRLRRMVLVPNRANVNINGVEAFDNDMSYVGSSICEANYNNKGSELGKYESCVVFRWGRTMLTHSKIILGDASNTWSCDRNGKDLSCRSNRYDCNFTKTSEVHRPYKPRLDVPVRKIVLEEPKQLAGTEYKWPECESWNRELKGFVMHRVGARLQPVTMSINAHAEEDANGKTQCIVNLAARLKFYTDTKRTEEIIFKFTDRVLEQGINRFEASSVAPREITVELWNDEQGGFNGNWHSEIFGFVGPLVLRADAASDTLPKATTWTGVFGFSGQYTAKLCKIQIFTVPQSDRYEYYSSNPYSAMVVDGTYIWGMLEQTWKIDSSAHFDYYTNYLVVKIADAWQVGNVTVDGLNLFRVNSTVMSGTASGYPVYRFKREM